jgi:hypothetical protein
MAAPHQGERHRGARGAATDHLGGPPRPWRRSATWGLTGGACHLRAMRDGHWRRLTVTHGHSNRFGPAPTPLEEPVHTNRGGWVEGWISPCGARPTDPVPGCGGPERWRRPRPDGTGATPKASAGSSATSGPRASGRQRTATVTRGLPSWPVNCLAGLPLQAVGTIDSLPYNPVDHATMRSPLPARAAVGRQQRAIWPRPGR